MVPEIWSETSRIFCHFGQFLPFQHPDNLENQNFKIKKKTPGDIIILHICTVNDNHMIDIWFLRYGAQQKELFAILDHFLPFYPPMDPESQDFGKINNTPEDIIIL